MTLQLASVPSKLKNQEQGLCSYLGQVLAAGMKTGLPGRLGKRKRKGATVLLFRSPEIATMAFSLLFFIGGGGGFLFNYYFLPSGHKVLWSM